MGDDKAAWIAARVAEIQAAADEAFAPATDDYTRKVRELAVALTEFNEAFDRAEDDVVAEAEAETIWGLSEGDA